ncbi:hypothetical protein GXW74_22165 [Roseomonas eburnea]|uniref:Uncharacterized protein n=1 Tax=Neoroseomonas eburnea TaxID=1346889 RepID=A0A9X9XHM3_9PROT|nr:hypothetical protein [Neoroseomonas eburnea]MBR0683209.1 hypothetical protein [Neoroseomonas eburnea]
MSRGEPKLLQPRIDRADRRDPSGPKAAGAEAVEPPLPVDAHARQPGLIQPLEIAGALTAKRATMAPAGFSPSRADARDAPAGRVGEGCRAVRGPIDPSPFNPVRHESAPAAATRIEVVAQRPRRGAAWLRRQQPKGGDPVSHRINRAVAPVARITAGA